MGWGREEGEEQKLAQEPFKLELDGYWQGLWIK